MGYQDVMPAAMLLKRIEDSAGKMARASKIMNQHMIASQKVVEVLLACMVGGDHVSLKGIPGTAKTRLVKTTGFSMGLIPDRIQFTPDIMPKDILGGDVLKEDPDKSKGLSHLEFEPGPMLKAQVLMLDEVNRAPARAQAATLQSMQERRATIGGITRPLLSPFFAMATQNPNDRGTELLPYAQEDRFGVCINVEEPDSDDDFMSLILASDQMRGDKDLKLIQPVLKPLEEGEYQGEDIFGEKLSHELQLIQNDATLISIQEPIIDLMKNLRSKLRTNRTDLSPDYMRDAVEWNVAQTRAGQTLVRLSRSFALMAGRTVVEPIDIIKSIVPVYNHRVSPKKFDQQQSNNALKHLAGEYAKQYRIKNFDF